MKAIAIIPARGGSKRIPGKNMKMFCGKPIIAYGIEAALQSGVFDEVMVSTDSEEIAKIARSYGASVPFFRSEKTSNDYAIIADVLDEVLAVYADREMHFDLVCCVYPTAPFVTAQKLRDAVNKLVESKADSLLPVVKFGFPPQRAVVVRGGDTCVSIPGKRNKEKSGPGANLPRLRTVFHVQNRGVSALPYSGHTQYSSTDYAGRRGAGCGYSDGLGVSGSEVQNIHGKKRCVSCSV